jgi:hypothetical protein
MQNILENRQKKNAKLVFSNRSECLHVLLRIMWEFPDEGESYSSWAIKESESIKGNLEKAAQKPGLGIALYTTELAAEVFGRSANRKIRKCILWGLNEARTPSRCIENKMEWQSTGTEYSVPDLRHTIALASIMCRAGDETHAERFLPKILDWAGTDGGWPDTLPPEWIVKRASDLPTTVYAVEYLTLSLETVKTKRKKIKDAIHRGQEWLISNLDNGWKSNELFPDKDWSRHWMTAYLLQRLYAAQPPSISNWQKTIAEATLFLLSRAKYDNDYVTQFRVEARIAAALSWSTKVVHFTGFRKKDIEIWLDEWEQRFLADLKKLGSDQVDLATATFGARALLRNEDYSAIAKNILKELPSTTNLHDRIDSAGPFD